MVRISLNLRWLLAFASLGVGSGCLQMVTPPQTPAQQQSGGGLAQRCQLASQFVVVETLDPTAQFGANSAGGFSGLAIDPAGSLYVIGYAWLNNYASSEAFVMKSSDGGHSWGLTSTIAGAAGMGLFADSSGKLFAAVQSAAGKATVMVSTDGAATWTQLDSFSDTGISQSWPETIWGDNQGHLVELGFQRSAYPSNYTLARISSDEGNTWSSVPTLDKNAAFTAAANVGAYAFTADVLGNWFASEAFGDGSTSSGWSTYKSSDQGQTWSLVDQVSSTTTAGASYSAISALGLDASGNLIGVGQYFGSDGIGHWRTRVSSNDGATWTDTDDIPPAAPGGWADSTAWAIATDAWGDIYVSGTIDYGDNGSGGDTSEAAVRLSSDGGRSWTTVEQLHAFSSNDGSYGMSILTDPRGQVFYTVRDYAGGKSEIRAQFCQ